MQGLPRKRYPRHPLLDLGQLASNPAFESEAGGLSARNMDTPRRPTPAPTAHPNRHTPTKIAYRPNPHTMSAGRLRKKSERGASLDRTSQDLSMVQGLGVTPSRLPALGSLKSPKLPSSAAATSGQDTGTTGTSRTAFGVAARSEAAEEASATPAAERKADTAAEVTTGAGLEEAGLAASGAGLEEAGLAASAAEGMGQEAAANMSTTAAASQQADKDEPAQSAAPSLEKAVMGAPGLASSQLGTTSLPNKLLLDSVLQDQLVSHQRPASLASAFQQTGTQVAPKAVWVDSPTSQVPAEVVPAQKHSPNASNRAALSFTSPASTYKDAAVAPPSNHTNASAAWSSQHSPSGSMQKLIAMPGICSSPGGSDHATVPSIAEQVQQSAPSSTGSRTGSRAASSPHADSALHVGLVAKGSAEPPSPSSRAVAVARAADACKAARQSSSKPSGMITGSKAVGSALQRECAVSDEMPLANMSASSGNGEAKQSERGTSNSEAVSSKGAAAPSQGRSAVVSKVIAVLSIVKTALALCSRLCDNRQLLSADAWVCRYLRVLTLCNIDDAASISDLSASTS